MFGDDLPQSVAGRPQAHRRHRRPRRDRDLVIADHACHVFDQDDRIVDVGPPGRHLDLQFLVVAGAFHAQARETIVDRRGLDWHAQVRAGPRRAQAENPALARSGIMIDQWPLRACLGRFRRSIARPAPGLPRASGWDPCPARTDRMPRCPVLSMPRSTCCTVCRIKTGSK